MIWSSLLMKSLCFECSDRCHVRHRTRGVQAPCRFWGGKKLDSIRPTESPSSIRVPTSTTLHPRTFTNCQVPGVDCASFSFPVTVYFFFLGYHFYSIFNTPPSQWSSLPRSRTNTSRRSLFLPRTRCSLRLMMKMMTLPTLVSGWPLFSHYSGISGWEFVRRSASSYDRSHAIRSCIGRAFSSQSCQHLSRFHLSVANWVARYSAYNPSANKSSR